MTYLPAPPTDRAPLETIEVWECACCGQLIIEDDRESRVEPTKQRYTIQNVSDGKLHGSEYDEGYCA